MHINFKIFDLVLIAVLIILLGVKYYLFPEAELISVMAFILFAIGILHIIRSNQVLLNKTYIQGQKNYDRLEKHHEKNKSSVLKSIFKEFQFTNFLVKKEHSQATEIVNYALDNQRSDLENLIKTEHEHLSGSIDGISSQMMNQQSLNDANFQKLLSDYGKYSDILAQSTREIIQLVTSSSTDQKTAFNHIQNRQQDINESISATKQELIYKSNTDAQNQEERFRALLKNSDHLETSIKTVKDDLKVLHYEGVEEQKNVATKLIDSYNQLSDLLESTKNELANFQQEGNLDFMQGINNLLASQESLSTQINNTKRELVAINTEGSAGQNQLINDISQYQKTLQNNIESSKQAIIEYQSNHYNVHDSKLNDIISSSEIINTEIAESKKEMVQMHSDNLETQIQHVTSLQKSHQQLQAILDAANSKIISLHEEKGLENKKHFADLIKLYNSLHETIPITKDEIVKGQKSIKLELEEIQVHKTEEIVTRVNAETIKKATETKDQLNGIAHNLSDLPNQISEKSKSLLTPQEFENEVGEIKTFIEEKIIQLLDKIETVENPQKYSDLLTNVHGAIDQLLSESKNLQESSKTAIDKELNKVVIHQDQKLYEFKHEILSGLNEKQEQLIGTLSTGATEDKIVLKNIYINTIIQQLDKEPIIIGGCGRSGSTLLLSMLSAHPNILTIPLETYVFSPDAYNPKMHHDNPFDLDKLYRDHISKLEILPTHDRWCEKSPKNVQFFSRILEYYPHARLIHLVRDGRDVILSKHPKNPSEYWVKEDRWIQDVSKGLELIDHPNVATIRYEDLILNYDETMARICDHINVDFNYHLKKWHRFAKIRKNEAWFGDVEPLYSSSIGRWKNKENKQKINKFLQNKRVVNILKELEYELPDNRTKVKKINA